MLHKNRRPSWPATCQSWSLPNCHRQILPSASSAHSRCVLARSSPCFNPASRTVLEISAARNRTCTVTILRSNSWPQPSSTPIMECMAPQSIKTTRLRASWSRRYIKIHSKKTEEMASSSNSPLSRNTSRLNTQASANTQADQVAEQSDVPCYTCRRRHVKCDRTLPACAKCAKKGVPCLGYQKPLRWAEGVAVRGKLKGKSQPVVDSKPCQYTTYEIKLNSVTPSRQRGRHCSKDDAAANELCHE